MGGRCTSCGGDERCGAGPENENFGKVLEDQDLVAVRNGASLVESLSTGKQVKVTAEWISGGNSAVDGGVPAGGRHLLQAQPLHSVCECQIRCSA